MRPSTAEGLAMPCLLSYYRAAQLSQLVQWHIDPNLKRWVSPKNSMIQPLDLDKIIWLPCAVVANLRDILPGMSNSEDLGSHKAQILPND
ncbi:hypothetical protein FKM82_022298 [Ascaphus truei]